MQNCQKTRSGEDKRNSMNLPQYSAVMGTPNLPDGEVLQEVAVSSYTMRVETAARHTEVSNDRPVSGLEKHLIRLAAMARFSAESTELLVLLWKCKSVLVVYCPLHHADGRGNENTDSSVLLPFYPGEISVAYPGIVFGLGGFNKFS
jgi:hypothetical protein